MNLYRRSALAALFGLTLAGCSGSNNPPTCSLNDPAQFPPTPGATPVPQGTPFVGSTWPKFRANRLNTGTVNNVTVPATGTMKCFPSSDPCFPPPDPNDHKGHFIASPVIGSVLGPSPNGGKETTFIYIGSTDNTMYKLSTGDLTQDTGFSLFATDIITSTAVVAVRDGAEVIFVGGGDSRLYGVASNSALQASYWPFPFNSFVSASPTLDPDGTVQVAAQSGAFASVCPNGIARYIVTTAGNQSSPALSANGTVYFGSDSRELHAVEADNGATKWAFSASAPVLASPVLEVQGTDTFVYAADRGGHVYKVNATTGQPITGFEFAPTPAAGPIWSSPALGNQVYAGTYTHLYFGSDDGNLYAIRTDTGKVDWQFLTGGPIVSSPAVAIDAPPGMDAATTNVVVVVKSNDGNLYFLEDAWTTWRLINTVQVDIFVKHCSGGTNDGTDCSNDPGLCTGGSCLPPPPTLLVSSPAIDADGTVYIGSDGGRVYAIR